MRENSTDPTAILLNKLSKIEQGKQSSRSDMTEIISDIQNISEPIPAAQQSTVVKHVSLWQRIKNFFLPRQTFKLVIKNLSEENVEKIANQVLEKLNKFDNKIPEKLDTQDILAIKHEAGTNSIGDDILYFANKIATEKALNKQTLEKLSLLIEIQLCKLHDTKGNV